ncbi:MAG: hypothetical protein ACI4CT_01785, partial [Lachnospiraceae bacterium]
YMKVTVTDAEATTLGTASVTLNGKYTDENETIMTTPRAKSDITIKLTEETDITVTLSKESGADPVMSWIGICKIVAEKDLGFLGYTTVLAGLPEKVTIEGIEQTVTWEQSIRELELYETAELTGISEDGSMVIATMEVYPDNLRYFVDCGDSDTTPFDSVKALSSDLLNTVGDQIYDDTKTWGITSTLDTDYKALSGSAVTLAGDKYQTGYSMVKNGPCTLSYRFHLPAGVYTVTNGFNEFWPGNAARYMKVTVTDPEATTLGTVSVTLDGTYTDENKTVMTAPRAKSDITIKLTEETDITVTLSKESGADPVMSWIGICEISALSFQGSQIRLNSTNPGFRFVSLIARIVREKSSFPDGVESIEYGNLLIPEIALTASGTEALEMSAVTDGITCEINDTKVLIKAAKVKSTVDYENDSSTAYVKFATLLLVGNNTSVYKQNFVVRPYLIYRDSNGNQVGEIVYAKQESRNMRDIAKEILQGETSQYSADELNYLNAVAAD